MPLTIFIRAAQVLHLKEVIIALWLAVHPSLPARGIANGIADAIVDLVASDPDPVFGSRELEAGAMAYWAFAESSLVRDVPAGDNGRSWGVWQEPKAVGTRPVKEQGRYWLRLLHAGALACPESPAAPLSGGCVAARKLADRRMARVQEILAVLE